MATPAMAINAKLFRLLLGAVCILSAILLWAFRNVQQVGDSLGIAYYVKIGEDVSNPHH